MAGEPLREAREALRVVVDTRGFLDASDKDFERDLTKIEVVLARLDALPAPFRAGPGRGLNVECWAYPDAQVARDDGPRAPGDVSPPFGLSAFDVGLASPSDGGEDADPCYLPWCGSPRGHEGPHVGDPTRWRHEGG